MLLLNVGSGSVVEFVWHILVNLLRLAQLDQSRRDEQDIREADVYKLTEMINGEARARQISH